MVYSQLVSFWLLSPSVHNQLCPAKVKTSETPVLVMESVSFNAVKKLLSEGRSYDEISAELLQTYPQRLVYQKHQKIRQGKRFKAASER